MEISIAEFLELKKKYSVVDVRSPSEYLAGYIPGSFNIPILDDESRKIVGTLYKKSGRKNAVIAGINLTAPRLAEMVQEALNLSREKPLLLYCWRGGMRSEVFAWLLKLAGVEVYRLKGGYKSYRSFARKSFSRKSNIIILGGMTGSGKTDILKAMENFGEQVLDLEGLACHKGSAFGSLGQSEQPVNEQFENETFEIWDQLDFNRRVWIEDESRKIGKVVINEVLYCAMRSAPVVKIDVKRDLRVKRIFREYAGFSTDDLCSAVINITKRLGAKDTKFVLDCINSARLDEAVDRILEYYDRGYEYGLQKRIAGHINTIIFSEDIPEDCAGRIIDFANANLFCI